MLPLRQMTGDAEFNEVFFDNVRVRRSQVVGEVDRGWDVTVTTLAFERGTHTLGKTVAMSLAFDKVVDLARRCTRHGRPAIEDRVVRQRLADLSLRIQALRFLSTRSVTRMQATGVPGPTSSIEKLHWSETNQRRMEFAVALQDPYGQLMRGSAEAVDDGDWQQAFLFVVPVLPLRPTRIALGR